MWWRWRWRWALLCLGGGPAGVRGRLVRVDATVAVAGLGHGGGGRHGNGNGVSDVRARHEYVCGVQADGRVQSRQSGPCRHRGGNARGTAGPASGFHTGSARQAGVGDGSEGDRLPGAAGRAFRGGEGVEERVGGGVVAEGAGQAGQYGGDGREGQTDRFLSAVPAKGLGKERGAVHLRGEHGLDLVVRLGPQAAGADDARRVEHRVQGRQPGDELVDGVRVADVGRLVAGVGAEGAEFGEQGARWGRVRPVRTRVGAPRSARLRARAEPRPPAPPVIR